MEDVSRLCHAIAPNIESAMYRRREFLLLKRLTDGDAHRLGVVGWNMRLRPDDVKPSFGLFDAEV